MLRSGRASSFSSTTTSRLEPCRQANASVVPCGAALPRLARVSPSLGPALPVAVGPENFTRPRLHLSRTKPSYTLCYFNRTPRCQHPLTAPRLAPDPPPSRPPSLVYPYTLLSIAPELFFPRSGAPATSWTRLGLVCPWTTCFSPRAASTGKLPEAGYPPPEPSGTFSHARASCYSLH